jgi:hypothetical protein
VSSALSRSTTIPSGDNLESVERIHVGFLGARRLLSVAAPIWVGVDVEGPKERSTLATSTTNKRYESLGKQADSAYRARSRKSYGPLSLERHRLDRISIDKMA